MARHRLSNWILYTLLLVFVGWSLPSGLLAARSHASRRYEWGPMILTSNQTFGSWGDVFGDRVIATAILDRVLYHAITINTRGNSYQLKDELKAGLVKPVEATT